MSPKEASVLGRIRRANYFAPKRNRYSHTADPHCSCKDGDVFCLEKGFPSLRTLMCVRQHAYAREQAFSEPLPTLCTARRARAGAQSGGRARPLYATMPACASLCRSGAVPRTLSSGFLQGNNVISQSDIPLLMPQDERRHPELPPHLAVCCRICLPDRVTQGTRYTETGVTTTERIHLRVHTGRQRSIHITLAQRHLPGGPAERSAWQILIRCGYVQLLSSASSHIVLALLSYAERNGQRSRPRCFSIHLLAALTSSTLTS